MLGAIIGIPICLLTGLFLLLAVHNGPPAYVDVTAALLQVLECNQTALGEFYVNAPPEAEFSSQYLNMTYHDTLCGDGTWYPPQPPNCCQEKVNVTDYFYFFAPRDNIADRSWIVINDGKKIGADDGDSGFWHHVGWFCLVIAGASNLIAIVIGIDFWWNERKRRRRAYQEI